MYKQILIFLFYSLVFTSCFENKEEFTPDKNYGNISDLVAKTAHDGTLVATINPTIENILSIDGNYIQIPANALLDDKGKKPSSSVEVAYNVSRSLKMQIQKNRVNEINGKYILPHAYIDIKFTQNGKTLMVDPATNGIEIFINMDKNEISDASKIYFWMDNLWSKEQIGETNSKFTKGAWTLSGDNGTIFGDGITVNLKRLGDLVVGQEAALDGNAQLCVELPIHLSAKNTMAFAILKDKNIVYRLEYDGNFCNLSLPSGEIVKVISFSEQKGKYFFGENTFKVTKSLSFKSVPEELTIDQISEIISSL